MDKKVPPSRNMSVRSDFFSVTAVAEVLIDIFQLPLTLRFVRRGHLLWTLIMRGDVSSNWNPLFSSATTFCIFCPEIVFYLN